MCVLFALTHNAGVSFVVNQRRVFKEVVECSCVFGSAVFICVQVGEVLPLRELCASLHAQKGPACSHEEALYQIHYGN